mmetsp:Transcript_70730/g.229096  ORF Transcript_70730/g.229096 Transcript_70730/m.229096 type:complete len:394 (+) Transcript_70730:372-1553(+)
MRRHVRLAGRPAAWLALAQEGLDLLLAPLEGADHLHEAHALVQEDHVGVLLLRGLVVPHAREEAQLPVQQALLLAHDLLVEAQGVVHLAHAPQQALLLLLLVVQAGARSRGPGLPALVAFLALGVSAGADSSLQLDRLLDDLVDLVPQHLELLPRGLGVRLLPLRHGEEGLGGLRLHVRAGPGLHAHLQLAAVRLPGLRRPEVEGLDPEQQGRGEAPVVRRELQPAVQVPAHLRLRDLVEADGALPAGLDELLLREAVGALPEVVPVLPAEVRDVVPELDLEVPGPPGLGLRQAQHPGQGTQLLRGHVREAELLLEELAEQQDLLEAGILRAFQELLLELLELCSLVRELVVVGLGDLAGALQHHLLPELRHLLLGLQLPRQRRIVVLLLEEG